MTKLKKFLSSILPYSLFFAWFFWAIFLRILLVATFEAQCILLRSRCVFLPQSGGGHRWHLSAKQAKTLLPKGFKNIKVTKLAFCKSILRNLTVIIVTFHYWSRKGETSIEHQRKKKIFLHCKTLIYLHFYNRVNKRFHSI